MYPELTGGRSDQDATRTLAARFHSFGGVLQHNPASFAQQFAKNLWRSLQLSSVALLPRWIVPSAALGVILALTRCRSPQLLFVILTCAAHLLLMALSHWETRYYFFVGVSSPVSRRGHRSR